MDDFTDLIFEIMTLQTGINHGNLSKPNILSGISELHLIYDFLDFKIRRTGWP